MSTLCARLGQFSLNKRWLRSCDSTGTERPVRIRRQMPRATCRQQPAETKHTARYGVHEQQG